MKVTIIGAGNMGRGIGTRVVAGGHDVEIVDRDPEDAQRLARELGGTALDSAASLSGEVVVFAEEVQELVPQDTSGVKAFNTTFAPLW